MHLIFLCCTFLDMNIQSTYDVCTVEHIDESVSSSCIGSVETTNQRLSDSSEASLNDPTETK